MTDVDLPGSGARIPAPSRPERAAHALLIVIAVVLAASCTSESVATPTSISPGPSETEPTEPLSDDHQNDPQNTPPVAATAAPSTSSPASTGTPAATAVAPATLLPPADPIGAVIHGTISHGGRERTYRLYVPADLSSDGVPLFIGLHGGAGWGDQFAQTNHIEGLAASNGFIVVHPDGIKIGGGPGGVWNGGVCCGAAARDGIDDVGFIEELIDQLAATYSIDPDRVYAFGHSNGGIMSYRLACESADRISGIGVYAGTVGVDVCEPSQPVPVIHVHGTADTNLPLSGGVGEDSIAGVDFPVPREGFDRISGQFGCPPASLSTVGDLTVERSGPCTAGVATEFVTIRSANHAWAGGTPRLTPASGPGYAGYDATSEIVAFLLAHPRS